MSFLFVRINSSALSRPLAEVGSNRQQQDHDDAKIVYKLTCKSRHGTNCHSSAETWAGE